ASGGGLGGGGRGSGGADRDAADDQGDHADRGDPAGRAAQAARQPAQHLLHVARQPGALAPGRRGQHRKSGPRGETDYLNDRGDDAGRGADLSEAEQAYPDRQQVAAEGGDHEPGHQGGGQSVPGRRDGRGQQEGGDDLKQEQDPDGRERVVPGQVKIKVDR